MEEPVETYHDEQRKSRVFFFPLTIAVIWAPYIVKYSLDQHKEFEVHLDTLEERWTKNYHNYDYVIFGMGQWYLKTTVIYWEKGQIIGCHKCAENYTEIAIEQPYRKALEMAFNFVASSSHKPLVFFRTWMPDHFEYGEWFSTGFCNRTRPYKEGQYAGKVFDQLLRNIEVIEFEKVVHTASGKGVRMELLDTFYLSLLRPDGHPGPYRKRHPFSKDKIAKIRYDCLHSCLPGPIDTLNDVMAKMLLNAA